MSVEGIGVILNKLQGVKPLSNGEFQACCPAHEDRKQSLNLKQEGDKILVTCHAGCQTEAVVQALHLSMADLFIKRGTSTATKEPPPQIVKTYSYPDEDSHELYQVVRMFPKSFRQRHLNGGGEWTWNMDGVRRVLYHLPEVLSATSTVYLVEGEKDADNLCAAGFIATTSPGGANNWKPEYAQYLQDKKVVLIPDKDKAGYKYASSAIESLKDKATSISVILLPGDDVKDISDWLETGGDYKQLPTMEEPIERLIALVDSTSGEDSKSSKEENNGLPEIRVTGRNTKDITADAIDALNKSNNPPTMFMRGSMPVRVSKDECDTPYIEVMNEPALRGRLDRVATYVKYVKNPDKQEGDEWKAVPAAVPLDVVRDVMSLPDFRLPALANITEIPTLRVDGSILSTPGYDAASKLYYVPSRNLIVPKIPLNPTTEEVRDAVNLINEVYINFPFDSPASRTNAIAATATCIYRPMFDGNVPLFIISKPQAGVGAGLMTAALCMTTTGHDPAMFGAPKDEDEWAKVIFAAVKAGQQIIIFDNCDGTLYSANLARLITAKTIGGRILGRSENAVMPNNSMIFCNGNNITLDGDLQRRSYLSRMETDADRPWERECNYLHSPLIPWVKANQGRIVAAYLTIAKAWIAAGKPLDDSLPRLGGFEEWQTVISGVLKNAGIEGFLGNRETVYRISDTGAQQWEAFTEALTSVFPEDFTVADVANLIFPKKDTEITSQGSDLNNALPDFVDKDPRKFSTSLGRALNKKLNVKWHNGWVITKPEEIKPRHHAVVWKIINWRGESARPTPGEVTSPPPESQGRLGEDKSLPTRKETENNNSYIYSGVFTSPTSPLGTKKGEVTQKAPPKLEKLGKCPVCLKENTEAMMADDSPEGFYYYCSNCYKEAN